MTVDIAVLVSAGRHPVSGRPRRAANDARAVELALALAERDGARVRLLHAGHPEEPALRDYLGMGPAELSVLPLTGDIDILPALVEVLGRWQPRLILTGLRTEAGWSGGCLPYALAEALGCSLVPNIDAVTRLPDAGSADGAELRQVCPRGRRRLLRARLPAVVTVDTAAPAPRQSAFARARRGRLLTESWSGVAVVQASPGEARPARRRPRRLQAAAGTASADERLQALTRTAGGHGRLVTGESAEEAARAILAYLADNDLLTADGAGPA